MVNLVFIVAVFSLVVCHLPASAFPTRPLPLRRSGASVPAVATSDFYATTPPIAIDRERLPASNITYTEWSILFDKVRATSGDEQLTRLKQQARAAVGPPKAVQTAAAASANKDDKGTTDSLDVLGELLDLNDDYTQQLNIFRRNIALRANRVLLPARNAQIFSTLINAMIAANEWTFARSVVDYVGLTPATYCAANAPCVDIDVTRTSTYILRKILELDLDRLAWVNAGRRPEDEPSTPRSRGESVQEWLYTQVHRSDLGFRAADMVIAVIRLALRHAVETRHAQAQAQGQGQGQGQADGQVPPIVIRLSCDGEEALALAVAAGIPLNRAFLERCAAAMQEDIELLPASFPALAGTPYLQHITIIT